MARFLCFLLLLVPGIAPAAAADLVVEAGTNYAIDATINGQPVRLRVDPEASGYIVLNPAAAARLGLRRSMLGSRTRIGPVRLDGSSKVANVSIGGVAGNRRLVWIDRPVIDGADGVIGPADMPYDRVTFSIAAPRAGETVFEMPMEFARGFGLYLPLRLGERDFRFQFSLMKPYSLATAGAGAELASLYGGSWAGDALDQIIEFDVARPVRPMVFARPVSLQGLELRALRVRTGDNRGNLSLPPEPDADPDELVVTGASRQRAAFVVHVGADRLSRCSAIIWDNRTRHMILNCLAAQAGL